MANAATISIQATMLPDEIAKTFSGSMIVSPDDANDKWYYKLTEITTTSADLIAGSYLDYTAVDQDTAPTAVATGDKVKFLFVQKRLVDSEAPSAMVQGIQTSRNAALYGF